MVCSTVTWPLLVPCWYHLRLTLSSESLRFLSLSDPALPSSVLCLNVSPFSSVSSCERSLAHSVSLVCILVYFIPLLLLFVFCYSFFTLHCWEGLISKSTPVVFGACNIYNLIFPCSLSYFIWLKTVQVDPSCPCSLSLALFLSLFLSFFLPFSCHIWLLHWVNYIGHDWTSSRRILPNSYYQ